MAEERLNLEPQEEERESRPARPTRKKKKKGCGCFLLSLLLLVGAAMGIQLSGAADLRAPLRQVVWSVPVIGPRLGERLGLSQDLPLTAEERRLAELEEREGLLREQRLDVAESQRLLLELSADLAEKAESLAHREEILAQSLKVEAQKPEISTEEIVQSIGMIFQEMSSRKAAKILEELDEKLAVSLLEGLPQDKSAEILGSMEASRAARLTEQLASRDSTR